MRIDFQTDPSRYRHWRIEVDGPRADLIMDVDEAGGLFEGYELKLNSYDLGVDIELHDAMQRLRFEHPEVRAVVLRSGKDRVFCAGANIRMLAGAAHAHKVNFCKFTNETRNAMEDASAHSGQRYIAAVSGACAGGGYELALASDHIILVDDGASSVSLPEVALLAVLPGTGGITRVTDKRKVRRDRADIFCSTEEGARGRRALDWRLVDEVVPPSKFHDAVAARVEATVAGMDGAGMDGAGMDGAGMDGKTEEVGISLGPLDRTVEENMISYSTVRVEIDREARLATVTIGGPETDAPRDAAAMLAEGDGFWPLRMARELDDALLDLRFNQLEVAVIAFKTTGSSEAVMAYDAFLEEHGDYWLAQETALMWTRVMKRVDLTSRSLAALIEPGSCFAGFLAELAFASDRSYMADGAFEGDNRPEATLVLSKANFDRHPMSNGLSRLATRFLGEAATVVDLGKRIGETLDASDAEDLGLVTASLDDIDWEDEVRLFLEERASFSPDALTGLEANTRFAGPETMETKIFGRLTAWQNWIFQRPNAVGETGALGRYGSGLKVEFDKRRV
jgi:benzoyl-CoA-dihydrodiol lyase